MLPPRSPAESQDDSPDSKDPSDQLTSEQLDQVAGGGVEPTPWHPQTTQPGVNAGSQPNLNTNAIIDDGRPAGH